MRPCHGCRRPLAW
ncbi:MAG: hypothetical protein DI635_06580 [Pseudoxanthomonas suwonensis]|nr:MAG: hypothetical protein DI635_06580 [Pseudoxanthomonas suwonensis]